jgi:hypothetical protein
VNIISHSTRQHRASGTARRPRRGIALVFVLIFVIAMAALSMSSNANLLAKSYDRERDLKFAAEAALAIGKSRVNADPLILQMRRVGQLDTIILSQQVLTGADGNPLSGIKVNVYVGPTGSTSGQFGRFSSIVAEARDQRGNGFIRRLELTQESFAKFAYWSNSESNGSTTIFFNNADELWGPVWSNDAISIGSGGAKFHDEVGTASVVNGKSYGTFAKAVKENQKPIPLPSTSILNNLQQISATSGWDFSSVSTASQDETNVRDRLEFVAFDLNASGDSTDLNEGLFKIYNARTTQAARGDYSDAFCGDWHATRVGVAGAASTTTLQFFPVSQHNTTWFYNMYRQSLADANPGWSSSTLNNNANGEKGASASTIMSHVNARCYLPGDNHLVAVERSTSVVYTDPRTALPYLVTDIQKGGMDTTFTPTGVYGAWKLRGTPDTLIRRIRGIAGDAGKVGDARYLYPIDRLYNASAKGVIHFDGNVALSGTLNGRITLYANGSIVLVDDLRYANDPVKGVCRDILGMISSKDIVIADNMLNTPQDVGGNGYRNLDETKDIDIHGVMMALGTSFRVENYAVGPTSTNGCNGVANGRGCIFLSGGIIQQARGPVGTSSGSGYSKRYSYDHCAVVNPPPYFPTTGRFQDNRYIELDPSGFNHTAYFLSLTPNP